MTHDLDAARDRLDAAELICPHTDADGLAAGAITLRHRGLSAADAKLFGRGHGPWTDPMPDAAAVLDQGVRETDRPWLLIDHHAPEGSPPNALVVSGFGEDPTPSTSALMRRLLPDAPAWLAAVGAAGDYGDAGLKLGECQPPDGEKLVKTHVKKLVSLVNAPRRLPNDPANPTAPHPAVGTALALLVEHESPKAALADARIAELEAAKQEYRAGLDAVMKTAPQVRDDVAVIRFRSPYQVHPLVAQTWQRRLSPKVVLVANDDYLPGRVNFAVRGGDGRDLRAFLRDRFPDQPESGGEIGNGHPGATGGSLTPDDFAKLLTGLGYDA